MTRDSHHIWCNGNPNSPIEGCKWCDGPNWFWAKYPYETEEECDQLVTKYFPNTIKRT